MLERTQLDATQVATVVQLQFPELVPMTVAYLGEGCDSAAFEVNWGGGSAMNAVLAAYEGPVDDGVLMRARFLAACRGVGDVAFGLETGRREYIDSGMRALDFCLGGDGPAGQVV